MVQYANTLHQLTGSKLPLLFYSQHRVLMKLISNEVGAMLMGCGARGESERVAVFLFVFLNQRADGEKTEHVTGV